MRPWLIAAAAGLCCPSCVQLTYMVRSVDSPVSIPALESLRPGVDDLTVCLQRLGAPHHVFEYRVDGMALLWHYVDGSGWGASVSYNPVRQAPGTSFNMELDDSDMPGAVLWFDADLKLLEWRQGMMRDLTVGLRRRPADRDQLQ